MRAMVIGEGGIEGLELVDQDDPVPGAHEVLIEMHATSLNYRDLGTVQYGAPSGLVPNSCGAGTVIAVGEGVTRFATGNGAFIRAGRSYRRLPARADDPA